MLFENQCMRPLHMRAISEGFMMSVKRCFSLDKVLNLFLYDSFVRTRWEELNIYHSYPMNIEI